MIPSSVLRVCWVGWARNSINLVVETKSNTGAPKRLYAGTNLVLTGHVCTLYDSVNYSGMKYSNPVIFGILKVGSKDLIFLTK